MVRYPENSLDPILSFCSQGMVEAFVVLIIDRFKDYVYSKRQLRDSSWQNLNLGHEQIKTFHTIPIDKTLPKQK